jgi:aspartate racemase
MRTLGLIGGTSWLSTIDYYRIINSEINRRLGGINSASIYMYSMNFIELTPPTDESGWTRIGERLQGIAHNLERAGADCIMICANTPHLVADTVKAGITVPFIHIAEVTAEAILRTDVRKVALLGTKFTMERTFYTDKLSAAGITTIIPDDDERMFIHNSIYNEMGKGIFSDETKQTYLKIIARQIERGAEGIIFGCTEIPMLIRPEDCPVPSFDTTMIHAMAAVEFALGG